MKRVMIFLMVAFILVFSCGCGEGSSSEADGSSELIGQWFVRHGDDTGNYLIFREDGTVIRFDETAAGYLAYGLSRDRTGDIVSATNWYSSGEKLFLREKMDEWLVSTYNYPLYNDEEIRVFDEELIYGDILDDQNTCERITEDEQVSYDEIKCIVETEHLTLADIF